MVPKRRRRQSHAHFVYAYELDPPQPEPQFNKIKEVLSRARRAAARGGHLWTGRIILETKVTHILIVTDRAGQVHDTDRAIENELRRLKAGFAVRGPARVPLPIPDKTKLGGRAQKRPPRSPAGSRGT
jgi:hypothetical protein